MIRTLLFSMKNHLISLASTVWIFLTPIKWPLFYLGVLVFSDMVLGLWRAFKEKQKIRSNYLRRTVVKMILYMAAIVLAYITQYGIGLTGLEITKIVASLIALVELKSVFENISRISNQPLWKVLVSKINGQSPKGEHSGNSPKDKRKGTNAKKTRRTTARKNKRKRVEGKK